MHLYNDASFTASFLSDYIEQAIKSTFKYHYLLYFLYVLSQFQAQTLQAKFLRHVEILLTRLSVNHLEQMNRFDTKPHSTLDLEL